MLIIGYTWMASEHCIGCTCEAALDGKLNCSGTGYYSDEEGDDENGLPYALCDAEGNSIHPIFDTDEGRVDEHGRQMALVCGTCHEVIREGDDEQDDSRHFAHSCGHSTEDWP